MYRGEIVERGPSDEVILSPAHPYTQLLASAAPDPTAPRANRWPMPARSGPAAGHPRGRTPGDVVDQGCRFRARCPHAMEVCATRPPDLPAVTGSAVDGLGSAGHVARCWLLDESAAAAPAADSSN